MAQWVNRKRADGGLSVQIKWRQDDRWQSETFTSLGLAGDFRTAVETAGNRWPEGWVRGAGWRTAAPEVDKHPGDAAPTFGDVTIDYFAAQDRRIRRGRVKPYTVHRARRSYALHVEEQFAHLAFADIDHPAIEEWIDAQLDADAAPKSIRNRHALISSIFTHGAGRMKLRPDNPCALSELPQVDTAVARQVRFFQHGEWSVLRACLQPDVHVMVDTTLATGVRFGELTAIRRSDITFRGSLAGQNGERDAAVIHVTRAWSRRAPDDAAPISWQEFENPSWVLGPPKGRRSRYVSVIDHEARQLHALVEQMPAEQYVFVTRYGNPWRYPDFHTDRWAPAIRAAAQLGLTKRFTFHMLRHTAVVWSLAEGVRIEVISEMLGHRSIQVTYDIYGGLINLQDPVMAEAMSRAMLVSAQSITPRFPVAVRGPLRPGGRETSRRRTG